MSYIVHSFFLIVDGSAPSKLFQRMNNNGTRCLNCQLLWDIHQRKFSGKLPIYELLGSLTGIVVLAVVVVAVVVVAVVVLVVVVVVA